MFTRRPKSVVCYVCGQQYGTASISIHVPRCIDKWQKVELTKAPKDRRPVPIAPVIFDAMIKGNKAGNYDLDNYNVEAFDHFNTVALVPCGCGRTFLPDSLIRHQKSCKGKPDIKRLALVEATMASKLAMPSKLSSNAIPASQGAPRAF